MARLLEIYSVRYPHELAARCTTRLSMQVRMQGRLVFSVDNTNEDLKNPPWL